MIFRLFLSFNDVDSDNFNQNDTWNCNEDSWKHVLSGRVQNLLRLKHIAQDQDGGGGDTG